MLFQYLPTQLVRDWVRYLLWLNREPNLQNCYAKIHSPKQLEKLRIKKKRRLQANTRPKVHQGRERRKRVLMEEVQAIPEGAWRAFIAFSNFVAGPRSIPMLRNFSSFKVKSTSPSTFWVRSFFASSSSVSCLAHSKASSTLHRVTGLATDLLLTV
jgi:hypothetical protein